MIERFFYIFDTISIIYEKILFFGIELACGAGLCSE